MGRLIMTTAKPSQAARSFARAKKLTEEMIEDDNKANLCMVRPLDRSVLGSKEEDFVPLAITDDRNFDYVDPKLKEQADLIISKSKFKENKLIK